MKIKIKTLLSIFCLLLLFVLCFVVVGCTNGAGENYNDSNFEDSNSSEKHSHVHNYSETLVDATCDAKGYTIYACSCGVEYNGNYVDMKGHDYKDKICTVCEQQLPKWDGKIASNFSGGIGSQNNPYLIANGAELAYLGYAINNNDNSPLCNKYFKLLNDIDLAGRQWDPIGCSLITSKVSDLTKRVFKGFFDGNGCVIYNLKINEYKQNNYKNFGLFGVINEGEVKNLGLANVDINVTSLTAALRIGGIVGFARANISNCYVEGSIMGVSTYSTVEIGGIAGFIGNYLELNNSEKYGIINNCYTAGVVSGLSTTDYCLSGGLVGCSYGGKYTNCYTTMPVGAQSLDDYVEAGGLIGFDAEDNTIKNCYFYDQQEFYLSEGRGNSAVVSYEPTNTLGTACTLEQLNSYEFYTETLLWDETIWDFSDLDFLNGKYPTLKV